MPLLILVIQGYLFALLLLGRFLTKKKQSDLFLALFLFITGIRCTSYIIGFMGWYDDFPNTKINYFLVDFSLLIGPIVYFYVKSITQPTFKLLKKDSWHFVPWFLYVLLQVFIYMYDSQQPGFSDVQNGVLYVGINYRIGIYLIILGNLSRFLYFFLAVKVFYKFRDQINEYFSNTYKVELNWLRNFLVVYFTLFIFRILFTITDQFIFDLTWIQNWWWYLLASIVLVYLGMMGVFADLGKLSELKFQQKSVATGSTETEDLEGLMEKLTDFMEEEKVYLNPELTISELSKLISIPTNEISRIINQGFKKNFKDFINELRVEDVKNALSDPEYSHFSILGIAMDCGFNSKATFNRVFKKHTGYSPSEFQSREST